jgi:hypothetical protein
MEGDIMKKNWTKPELIILKRGLSQEAVLTFCKAPSVMGDPTLLVPGQYCGNDKANSCQNCQSRPTKS